jgi:hypothetical protein
MAWDNVIPVRRRSLPDTLWATFPDETYRRTLAALLEVFYQPFWGHDGRQDDEGEEKE